jgi:phage major head subunit gpT-like protein
MTLTPSMASYVIDETVSSVALDEFAREPLMLPQFFSVKGSSKDREITASIGGLGDFQLKATTTESSESEPVQQFSKSYIHNAYALQTKVARELIDDQRVEFFGQFGAKLGQSASRTMEKAAADLFNNAFTTTTSEDGLSLCNSAHLNADSGNSQDNSGTSTLSNDAVSSTRQLMRRFKDYDGNVIASNPDLLLIPAELEETGVEIVRSSLNPQNANNAVNWNQGLGMVVWMYLTDTTNWFLLDSKLMKQNLNWYQRVPLEVFGDGDLFKGQRRIGGYYRESHGVADWRWIYGHVQ